MAGRGGWTPGGPGRGGYVPARGGWLGRAAARREILPGTLRVSQVTPMEDRHVNDVVTLLWHGDHLLSGADDGKIKVWTSNLDLVSEIQAHPVNVYSIAVLGDTLYSCSNDGTVKAWDVATLELKRVILEDTQREVMRLCVCDGRLFAGNDQGDVHVFENDEKIATYSLEEDIADFTVMGDLVFNARNTDVSVTEMRPGPRFGYWSRGAMIGRFPILLLGERLCFLSRSGRSIYVHSSSKEQRFKRLSEIKAHEMTITALCGLSGREEILLSGGYDRVIRAWDLRTYKKLAQLELGLCVNELCSGPDGQVYAASSDGFIGRLDTELPA